MQMSRCGQIRDRGAVAFRGAKGDSCFSLPVALIAIATVAIGCHKASDEVPQLTERLRDTDPDERYISAKSLGNLGEEAKGAVPALMDALKDPDVNVRMTAAYSLGKIGHDAVAAVPALTTALEDRDPQVRAAAANSLPALGREAAYAISVLKKVQYDRDPTVRTEAFLALKKIELVMKYQDHAPTKSGTP
jgi:HEAT repeat protein